jgi:hypothetical protein
LPRPNSATVSAKIPRITRFSAAGKYAYSAAPPFSAKAARNCRTTALFSGAGSPEKVGV